MHTLLAVIDELYTFALESILALFGQRSLTREDTHTSNESRSVKEESLYGTPQEVQSAIKHSSFKKVESIISPEREVPSGGKNTIMYVGSTELPMYKNPTPEFDAVSATLSYGDMVMMIEEKGRWSRVVHGEEEGWMLRDELVDRAAHVYPKFVIGEQNNADDPNTFRVRAMLHDMFGGAAADLPLQAGEYIMYRLIRKGLQVSWPQVRPRVPGAWHSILKGVPGVHIGVTPKTGSVMEYMYTDEIGHLAYVEAVFPNETINISEVNYPDSGIYNERVLTRDEWREFKPVFVQIT